MTRGLWRPSDWGAPSLHRWSKKKAVGTPLGHIGRQQKILVSKQLITRNTYHTLLLYEDHKSGLEVHMRHRHRPDEENSQSLAPPVLVGGRSRRYLDRTDRHPRTLQRLLVLAAVLPRGGMAVQDDSREWFACEKVRKRFGATGAAIERCSIPEIDASATNFSTVMDHVLSRDQTVPTMIRHAAPAKRDCLGRSSTLSGPMAGKPIEYSKSGDGAAAVPQTTTLGDFVRNLVPGCGTHLDGTPLGVLRGLTYEDRELTTLCPTVPASIQSQSLQITTEKVGREIEVRLGGLFVGAAFARESELDSWVDVLEGRLKWLLHDPRCGAVNSENAFSVWMKTARTSDNPYCSSVNNVAGDCAGEALFDEKKNEGPADCSSFRPMECVQNPGDVLFVPRGWHSASFNLGETVYAVERGKPLDQDAKKASIKAAKSIIEAMVAVRPDYVVDSSSESNDEVLVSGVAPKSLFDGVLPHERTSPSPARTNCADDHPGASDYEDPMAAAIRDAAHEVDEILVEIVTTQRGKGDWTDVTEWIDLDGPAPREADASAGARSETPVREKGPDQPAIWPPPHAPF